MSFNTKYILPGDDKNQILSKINQNFSQVYFAGVGLAGEAGPIGPTGIIGQVGKDGATGPEGTRANIWIFQETPPDISFIPKLENFDIWVNTSPTGSTGGLNRIYQFIFPFWNDTGQNFVSGNTFSLIQGIKGPGQITEKNAIVAGTTGTFVFGSSQAGVSDVNLNYSKALISNPSASLPSLEFSKTFYSSENPPSFSWISNDYDIEFSCEDEILFQSQATGSYLSPTGPLGITAGNSMSINSSGSLGISGPSGISVSSSDVEFKSSNLDNSGSNDIINFNGMNSGFSVFSSSAEDSFRIQNTNPPGDFFIFLNYNGGVSGTVNSIKPNVSLSMAGDSLFRINNSSSGSFPALSIGYTGSTGSTGPSGGTGANVYKSYQTVISSASSSTVLGTPEGNSNYIPITPENDVIRVVPNVPSGSTIRSNNRPDLIWIYLTDFEQYIESNNAINSDGSSVIDIYMDSSQYAIGGIAIETNYTKNSGIYGTLQLPDSATGPDSGCRHARVTFFGRTFPGTFNTLGNKTAYIQAFVSTFTPFSKSERVFYFYTPSGLSLAQ
jgi:hypothetical protein